MRKKFQLMIVLMLLLAITFSAFQPVFAQGPFDMTCPECHGTGKISCSTCQGTGQISSTSTCTICHGSGQTTVWQKCTSCDGSGKIAPTITLKSMDGWGTLVGLDWVARVQGVFHNEEDEGTYGIATSKVNTVTKTYYHSSQRTYFAAHEDTTITIDTPEIGFGEDWAYTIYISSKDDIECPSCDGSAGKSVVTTCSECNGSGKVTTTQTCSICNGIGSLLCSRCNGRGYVTNQSAVNLAIFGVAVVIIGSVLGVTVFALSRRKRQEPVR